MREREESGIISIPHNNPLQVYGLTLLSSLFHNKGAEIQKDSVTCPSPTVYILSQPGFGPSLWLGNPLQSMV